jgi:Zn-dependent protease
MDILSIVISLFAVLFAITIHEASHGWAAWRMGDPTAYAMGRVTLNPVAHIDPFGTIILPVLLVVVGAPAFGWAKPVPVNPYNLRNPRRDNLWISLAGPASNLTAATAALVLLVFLKLLSPGLTGFLRGFLLYRQEFPRGFFPLEGLALILFFFALINAYLAFFNLIPIPPLDGGGILAGMLSDRGAEKLDRIRPFGFLIILALIYLRVLDVIIYPIRLFIYTIVFF